MPTPKDAEAKLRSAVDAQKAQRAAAETSKRSNNPPAEDGIERADSDAEL